MGVWKAVPAQPLIILCANDSNYNLLLSDR